MSYSHTEVVRNYHYTAEGKATGWTEVGVRDVLRDGRILGERQWPAEFHREFDAKGKQVEA